MMRWWRKALATCLILLLITSAVLFLRLDPNKLGISIQSQFQQWAGQKVLLGPASLSLLHGASLRIQDIEIGGKEAWHLHADSIRMGLSLWSLLQGDTEVKTVDIIRPTLTLPKLPQIKNVVPIALPTSLKKMRIRQGRIQIAGSTLAQNLDGMIRRISRGQELTWELQSKFSGGDVASQGRIRYNTQNHPAVFGKIQVKRVALHPFSGNPAAMPLPLGAYDTLDTTLTFDIGKKSSWSLFGDATFHAKHKHMPPVIWRGKINGESFRQFTWRDAFLQLGRKTMFAITGGCTQKEGCNFGIDTRNAEIPLILKAANLHWPVKGTLDVTSSFSWKDGQWSARGKLASHHFSWSDITVPDVTISVPETRYHDPEHFELADIHLQSAHTDNGIVLDRLTKSGRQWNLEAHARNTSGAWAPLINILLKSHKILPDLHGKGTLSAKVHAVANAGHTGIDFSVDVSQAQLLYGKKFKKPMGVRAKVEAHVDTVEDKTTLSIHEMDLGRSHAAQSQWMFEQGNIQSVAVKNMHIDLTKLAQAGIVFPDAMKNWHGAIRGHFSRLRPSAKTGMPEWFAPSGATLELAGFGAGNHQWNGLINIREGTLSTQNLLWKNTTQYARLRGNINLASLHGTADIQDAALSWKQGNALPAWLSRITLHGRLHNVALNWMGDTWGGLHGAYRSNGNHITLKKIRAKLAGGSVQSPALSLILTPEAVRFSGLLRMAIVRPAGIKGLAEALGANLDGYVYLNARLEGGIPWRTGSIWQGNGDIEIQQGHWQPVDKKLTITVGDLHTETGKTASFSRFSTHFHLANRVLQLTHIQLETGPKQITGNAFVHPDGEVGGNLQIKDEHGRQKSGLIGNWPAITALFGTK